MIASLAILSLAAWASISPSTASAPALVGPETATINVGTPSKDATVNVRVRYGNGAQNDGFQVPVTVAGVPDGQDSPQDTPTTKATKIAAAINEGAKGEDGQAGTADDHPVSATSSGAIVIVTHDDGATGGEIRGLGTTPNGSGEKDVTSVATALSDDILIGEIELRGVVAAYPIEVGQAPVVEVSVGGVTYTQSLTLGDTVHDVLLGLQSQLATANISSQLIGRNRLVIRVGTASFGGGSNDRGILFGHDLMKL